MDEKTEKSHLPVPLIGIAVCIGVLLVLGTVAFLSIFSYNSKNNRMNRYVIGTATDCGYIGVFLTYDTVPVDIVLLDSDGHKYIKNMQNVFYECDEQNKTITLLTDSDNIGIWSADFNTKSNKHIKYSFVQTPSETLYITNPHIVQKDDGNYYLLFETALSNDAENTAICNLTLSKSSFSYGFNKTEIALNTEVEILLQFPDHTFTNENYKLRISLNTASNKATNTEIPIHINAKPQEKEN